jgi:hypothetical protein
LVSSPAFPLLRDLRALRVSTSFRRWERSRPNRLADTGDQEYDQWVLLVSGSAGLWIEGDCERELSPGDYILIPAHRSHRRNVDGEIRAYSLACYTPPLTEQNRCN